MTNSAEERVYLQVDGDAFGDWEGVTWCKDQINDTDVEYVRADLATASAQQAREEALREAANLVRDKWWEYGGDYINSHQDNLGNAIRALMESE